MHDKAVVSKMVHFFTIHSFILFLFWVSFSFKFAKIFSLFDHGI